MRYLLAIIPVAAVVSLSAQVPSPPPSPSDAPGPQFEVASVKRNTAGSPGGALMSPPGRFTANNIPLRLLIINAYRLSPDQVVGGPSWIGTDRFDITAKAPDGARPDQTMLMLQALLAERFKLVAHKETRDTPIYTLVKARDDGRLGPGLTRSTVDCEPIRAERAAAARAGGPGPIPVPQAQPNEKPVCSMRMMGRAGAGGGITLDYRAGNVTMVSLASFLRPYAGREIVEKTGLTGEFDVELQFAPPGALSTAPAAGGGVPAAPLDEGATVFTALPEQLGLKLESGRGPVEFLVIDSVEQPTGD